MTAVAVHSGLETLDDALWRERGLLEHLLFKLVSANLGLLADDPRLIEPALSELDRALATYRGAATARAQVMSRLAGLWGVEPDVGLDHVIEHRAGMLRIAFEEHQSELRGLARRIENITSGNRLLAKRGLDTIRGALGLGSGDTYDATGRPELPDAAATHVDRAL